MEECIHHYADMVTAMIFGFVAGVLVTAIVAKVIKEHL